MNSPMHNPSEKGQGPVLVDKTIKNIDQLTKVEIAKYKKKNYEVKWFFLYDDYLDVDLQPIFLK